MKVLLPLAVVVAIAVAGCKQQTGLDPVSVAPPIPAKPHVDKIVTPPPVEKVAPVTEADLGLPFYPGSKAIEKLSSAIDTSKNRTIQSARTTPDDYKKVAEFYFKLLKNGHKGELGHEGMLVDGQLKDGSMAQIQAMKSGSSLTQVQVTVLRPPLKK